MKQKSILIVLVIVICGAIWGAYSIYDRFLKLPSTEKELIDYYVRIIDKYQKAQQSYTSEERYDQATKLSQKLAKKYKKRRETIQGVPVALLFEIESHRLQADVFYFQDKLEQALNEIYKILNLLQSIPSEELEQYTDDGKRLIKGEIKLAEEGIESLREEIARGR